MTRIGTPPEVALLLAAVGCALLLGLPPASATMFDARSLRAEVLPNGLHVVVEEEPEASVVAVEVVVRAGAAHERPEESGAAHLLEHVLWATGGKDDPRAAIEGMGGVTDAGTLRDFTHYYATLPAAPGSATFALQELAKVVLREPIEEAVVEREKQVIAGEMAGREESPRFLLSQLAFETAYGKYHPYSRPLEGRGASFSALDAAKLGAFRRLWYVPNNMSVVVVGQVQYEEVMAAVRAAFGGLTRAPVPGWTLPPPARPAPPRETKIGTAGKDAYLMAAFIGPAITEPVEVCATDTLSVLLMNVTYGRLRKRLQGPVPLVRATGVEFLTQRDRALLGIWAVCDPARVPAVKQAIEEELSQLAASPVSPQELAVAKRLASADYSFSNETPSDRARTLAFYEALGHYREAGQYPLRVKSLRAADLAEVAAWYAAPPVWAVLTPTGKAP